ncbi:MAG: hypothetical protein RL334_232 [Chloroflexota bacterium]
MCVSAMMRNLIELYPCGCNRLYRLGLLRAARNVGARGLFQSHTFACCWQTTCSFQRAVSYTLGSRPP